MLGNLSIEWFGHVFLIYRSIPLLHRFSYIKRLLEISIIMSTLANPQLESRWVWGGVSVLTNFSPIQMKSSIGLMTQLSQELGLELSDFTAGSRKPMFSWYRNTGGCYVKAGTVSVQKPQIIDPVESAGRGLFSSPVFCRIWRPDWRAWWFYVHCSTKWSLFRKKG